jgi:recombination protein U
MRKRFIQYANRGKRSESLVEHVIDKYNKWGHSIIQKVSTPITITEGGGFTYGGKSTVDFIGIAYFRAIAFDVKKTEFETRFPLSNVKNHQYEFLKKYHQQRGISFLLVEFEKLHEWYIVPFLMLERWWSNPERKSIPYEAFQKEAIKVNEGGRTGLDFLEFIIQS